jgi:hypothetical protein
MRARPAASSAAVGIVVKSGWAAAVLVAAAPSGILVVDSRRVELSDPANPESRQPYHDGFATARDAGDTLAEMLASVRRFGRQSMVHLLKDYGAGHQVTGMGIVVGSLIDPAHIANDHIRIHALEGRLFRTIVADAAERHDIPSTIWREKDLYEAAVAALGHPEPFIRRGVTAFGKSVSGSWRAEHKAATTAAWMVLAAAMKGNMGARAREGDSA